MGIACGLAVHMGVVRSFGSTFATTVGGQLRLGSAVVGLGIRIGELDVGLIVAVPNFVAMGIVMDVLAFVRSLSAAICGLMRIPIVRRMVMVLHIDCAGL